MSTITEQAPRTIDIDQGASQGRSPKRLRTENIGSACLTGVSIDISGAACERCHSRKVKCGGEFPTCAGCRRANVRCMVHDPGAPREYSREEFQQLYDKAQRLERELGGATGSFPRPGDTSSGQGERASAEVAIGNGSRGARRRAALQAGRQRQAPNENRFVGQDTAFGFFLSRLHPSRVRGAATAQPERPELRTPRMPYHAPHPFPPRDTALVAVRDYFQHHHPAQPVLSPEMVYDTLDRYTLNTAAQSAIEATDLFRLFMALAIGSIRLFRAGTFEPHPFGYFTAALEVWTPSMSSFNTIEDIEHFLLIAQFGFFYDIGCSIWELGRLSMRTAVELGLHCPSPSMLVSVPSSQTDRSRRVFWMAYMLDRSSSYTLGRPFAIDDTSIATPFPDAAASYNANHNWRIGLSRLTSQIRCSLRPKRGFLAKESAPSSQQALHMASSEFSSTITLLRKFNNQLQDWRTKAPSQDEATCLIESPQHFDLLYQEARLGLLRAAIDKLAISPMSLPRSLLRPSLSAACSIISTFDYLRHTNLLTCTRAEAHLIFVTSLVVLSLNQASDGLHGGSSEQGQGDINEDPWLEFLDDGCFHLTPESVSRTIKISSQLLSWLCEALPDFVVCARIFEETRRSLGLERIADSQPGEPAQRPDVDTQVQDTSSRNRSNDEASSAQSWTVMADGTTERPPPPMNGTYFQGQGQVTFDDSGLVLPEIVPGMGSFDLTAASLTEGFGVPAMQGVNALSWPLSNFEGMAAIDACFSGYVWDTHVPWEGSPSVTMDSV